jgi:2-oxoglutarate ferredoxin oxidoreductase subunit beta
MTVFITGIGCNAKMSQYTECYGAETLHGRPIPFATGVKLARPELTVISMEGDGGSYGIGLGHLLHAARRNVPILHITCDNENYALTTGQASATTPQAAITKSTPQGNTIPPFHPVHLVESAGGSFVRMVKDKEMQTLKETIKEALQFPGFAHINVQQTCPSWKRW